jgi:hypothetical protein
MSTEGPKSYPVVYDAENGLQYSYQTGYVPITPAVTSGLINTELVDIIGTGAITVTSTDSEAASVDPTNIMLYTPLNADSTCYITIVVNVACDGMGTGSALYVTPVVDGVTLDARGIMQAAGFSGHLVWDQTIVFKMAFGDTTEHSIQIGGYTVGTVTTPALANDTLVATTYMVQEIL